MSQLYKAGDAPSDTVPLVTSLCSFRVALVGVMPLPMLLNSQ